ncbi:MAG: hypothetical protein D6732_04600 [Methanobacteriota archaeon]|nr:MAG: hypothetical protein D6732_04600 [Euryarchaeota archaeon]
MNVMISNFDRTIQVLQLAHHLNEVDVYFRSGANWIIIGEFLMSRAMLQIMLAENRQTTSIIYGNFHLFEMMVRNQSKIRGKNPQDLRKRDYFAILVKRGERIFTYPLKWMFEEGDIVLLVRKRRLVEKY